MIRYPHDRQHREPAVSKRDGIPAVGAGSGPVRHHEPAYSMCHIELWRGKAALPFEPLTAGRAGRRSRKWIGSSPTTCIAPPWSHIVTVSPCLLAIVDAVSCGPASLLAAMVAGITPADGVSAAAAGDRADTGQALAVVPFADVAAAC